MCKTAIWKLENFYYYLELIILHTAQYIWQLSSEGWNYFKFIKKYERKQYQNQGVIKFSKVWKKKFVPNPLPFLTENP